MKHFLILISFSILLINCTKEHSNANILENWVPTDTYLKAYIDGKYVEVGYIDSIGIGRKIYDIGPNDSLYLWKWQDYFINGFDEVLAIGFIKKVSINDFDTSFGNYTYNNFENYIHISPKCNYLWDDLRSHSEVVMVQYKLGDNQFNHFYAEKLDTNLFTFQIDSLKYFEIVDNRNINWMNFTINGKFKCQLVNYDNIEDTINITNASFRAWITQSEK